MKAIDRIEEYFCVVCLSVMTLLVFVNVFSRYVLHMSFSFSEEITTNLFVLLSMMGTAIGTKRRAHLGLSIITDAVGPRTRKILLVSGFAIGTIFSLALLIYGVQMVMSQYRLGQVTASMQWPEWIFGTFIPFGAFFVTLRFAQATVEEWKAPEGETDEKEAENV